MMICVFTMQKKSPPPAPNKFLSLKVFFLAPNRQFIGPFDEGIPSNNMAFAEGLRSSAANRPFGGCHG